MPSFDSLFNAFVTILVTIDPPGLAPLFLAVTRGMNREERQQVSIRASIMGFLVMALLAVHAARYRQEKRCEAGRVDGHQYGDEGVEQAVEARHL